MLRKLFLLTACLLACGLAPARGLPPSAPTASPVIELLRADLLRDEGATPPRADDPAWHSVELPAFWREEAVPGHLGGWYRLRFSAERPREVWGLLLWRLHMNAAVWFNGEFVGDGGRMEEPVARNWNRPLYFTLPAGLWRDGENEVLVRLKASPGYAMLAPPQVGPDALLRPQFERRYFLQVEVSAALALLLTACGLFMLGLWWQRHNDAAYLWFGLSCLFWSQLAAYLFVRDPPLPGELFRWLAHSSADGWIACLVVFCLRFLGERHRRLERLILGVPLVAAVAALASLDEPLVLFDIFRVSHGFGLAVGIGCAIHVTRRWRVSGRRDALLLTIVLAAIVGGGLHDWFLELPNHWISAAERSTLLHEQYFISAYAAPLAFLFLAGHLVRRFVRAMTELEALRDDLEDRVEAGREALQQSFEQQKELERSQAAADERERIYRDLHDDIGAKLLALVIGAENRLRADLARSALQDLRDVVSRSAQGDTPLCALCADWRQEIEQRLADAGIGLDWHQAADLPDTVVKAGDALHLGRIMREAVSNAIRHAKPGQVKVRVDHDEQELALVIEDDGIGFAGVPARIGKGLRNMRHRAEQLGADIHWERADERGCRVRLRVPRTRFAAA